MGHHHHHYPHHHGQKEKGSSKSMKAAFILNLSFTLIEVVGGVLTNSVAILSDAVHDLGDTIALGLGLHFENYSRKSEDEKYTYGYRRYSTLSAIINSLILIGGSMMMVIKTIPRLFNPEEVDSQGMLWLAVLGIIINLSAFIKLRSDSNSANQRVMMLHFLEDVLGWVAILIGSIAMEYFNAPLIIDPIMSLGIACYIIYGSFKNFLQIAPIFLQAVPKEIKRDDIEEKLDQLSEIVSSHDMHVWSLDGEFHVMSIHLVVDDHVTIEDCEKIKKNVRHLLSDVNINHITIEIDTKNEDCGVNCID